MRLLIRAALRAKRHFSHLFLAISMLLLLTVASNLEMFGLGIITKTGADFFELFGSKKNDQVSLEEVRDRWKEIDQGGKGVITKRDAVAYVSSRKESNPLNMVIKKCIRYFDMEAKGIEIVIGLLIFIAVLKGFALFMSRFATQLLSIRVSRDLRQQFFEHIQTLPMSFYHRYNIGALSSRVAGDASQIANSLNSLVTNYLQTPFTIMTSLGGCFYVSWKLSLVIFVGLPAVILPIIFLTKKVKNITRQLQRNQERFTSVLIDFLAGIQTVKIFSMERFSLRKYQEQNDQMAKLETKTAKYDLLTRPILHMVTTICLSSVLLFGLYALNMSFSELIVFCGLLYLFYEPVKRFAEENSNIQKGVVAAERLFEVLELKPDIEDKKGAIDIREFKDSIVFDKVWFRYDEQWILKDVSFEVKKGETVALVGATGAGKSTIVQLLPRLYDVEQGQILIDGKPVTDYTSLSLRELISYVPQKPFLFYDTVSANIAYGKDFSLDEIVTAAKKAHAHEFIERLPDGNDFHLSETGKNLSGGQQQRLAIARALVKNAPILVLDEATSSLDSISEHRIKKTIQQLHGEVTQVLIAHRLTTIQHADRIIFLEQGEKVAEGTKEELFETCPQFKLMWETHFLTTRTKKTALVE